MNVRYGNQLTDLVNSGVRHSTPSFDFSGMEAHPLGRIGRSAIILRGQGVPPGRRLRTYPSYALMLVLRGEGEYRDGRGLVEPLQAGSLVIVFPGFSHTYSPKPGQVWDELYVVFDGRIFDAWRQAGVISTARPVIQLGDPEPWRLRITDALARLERTPLQTFCDFQSILADCLSFGDASEGPEMTTWLNSAKVRLTERLSEPIDVRDIAEALGQSYESFRKKFKASTGVAPGAFRLNARLGAASDLLRFTDLTQADIADRLGFGSEFYFSAQFKRATGLSPSAFRRGDSG